MVASLKDPPLDDLDPLLQALVDKLPRASKRCGTGKAVWAADQRKEWLALMERSFDVVYGRQDGTKPAPPENWDNVKGGCR